MSLAAGAAWVRAWGRAGHFALATVAAALSRSTYTPQTREVALRQIYFSAWQVLVGFTLFSALLSTVLIQITINFARAYGLSSYARQLVFHVLVLELLPLGTALFVAIRSG